MNKTFKREIGVLNNKLIGIILLLVFMIIITSFLDPRFLNPLNIRNILRWTGLFGILSLGVTFPIITGGIDLSIGSVVGLTGTLFPLFIVGYSMNIGLAFVLVLGLSLLMGLAHGVLITKFNFQPFIATLVGLFIYRGLARVVTRDVPQGFGGGRDFASLRFIAQGRIPSAFWSDAPQNIADWSIPMPFIILIILAIVFSIFLYRSIYGRYLLALGFNEKAARFSGINVNRMKTVAYIISTMCAGFAGILFALDLNTIQPSAMGNAWELYAIAGVVLGGASLRGGEANILGVVIAVVIIRALFNMVNILGLATQLEFAILGIVILLGVMMDEYLKKISARRMRIEVSLSSPDEITQVKA